MTSSCVRVASTMEEVNWDLIRCLEKVNHKCVNLKEYVSKDDILIWAWIEFNQHTEWLDKIEKVIDLYFE